MFGIFLPGISGKSQLLFALVFTTRYLDLFTSFISAYNTVMKVRRGLQPPKVMNYSHYKLELYMDCICCKCLIIEGLEIRCARYPVLQDS